ncbi:bifunctional riboflavin kinase/FAD synthetase [Caviibacter abscessus]|uniref:bifunctional riboflavin kinase/FAD synthetase n=1 Tax=Caviibacter abscessus TaxID=1766719 RepID=UPI000ADF4065|nr:bifunctional riboflavin kinase/FAD synthetase [Caviibacter abscessus]
MQVIENNNVVILGNFDGVHIGHKKLINEAIIYAKKNKLKTLIYIFENFPYKNKVITTLEEKITILKDLGIDEIYLDDFNVIKNLNEIEFVNNILKQKLNAKIVFCGFNYTFGHNKSGNANKLKELIETNIIEEVKLKGITVSSTLIRNLILSGYMETASKFLGRPYNCSGIVVKGKQIGRTIGFPTANILPEENKIYPPYGAYGTTVRIEGMDKTYQSIMNIGKNPTIDNKNRVTIETNIFDFNSNIYGKKIKVILHKRLRCEKKFDSLIQLKEQIYLDTLGWRMINDKY